MREKNLQGDFLGENIEYILNQEKKKFTITSCFIVLDFHYETHLPLVYPDTNIVCLQHLATRGLQSFLALNNKQCRMCILAHKWDVNFLRLPVRVMHAYGVLSVSTMKLHLAIKLCDISQIKIPTLCQGFHMSTSFPLYIFLFNTVFYRDLYL